MNIPVTYTAILPPRRRANLLTRQRLLDLLLDLMEHPLILVVAPPGYGKTYLLIDFARNSDFPVCWYTIDPHDHNLWQFLAHFIAAIQHRFPAFGSAAQSALQSTSQSNPAQMAKIIVNDIYESIQDHFALVLDDYHLVEGNDDIAAFIGAFVQRADEHCHLILSSRYQPSIQGLDLLVSRSQVGAVCLEDLAFRADEIQDLALQNYHQTIPSQIAEELHRESEGWITGLLLSVQDAWKGMPDRLRVARASGIGLYDYLARQFIDHQPAEIKEFLLRSSLLEEFDAEICEAVLGKTTYPYGTNWEELIQTIRKSNLFMLPVDDRITRYRYHNLLREFLQKQLEREKPEEKEPILRRLADYYVSQNEWEKAYDIYQEIKDFPAVVALIEQVGSRMIQGGRFRTLAEWLNRLPAEVLNSRPALLSLRGGVAIMGEEISKGVEFLNEAVEKFRDHPDVPGLARALARRSTASHFLGNYQASLIDAEEILSFSEDDQSLTMLKAEALNSRGLNLLWLGDSEEAIRDLEKSLKTYERVREEHNIAHVLQDLGLAYRAVGNFIAARDCYQKSLDYWQKTGNLHRVTHLLNNLGVLYFYHGDYEKAGLSYDKALKYARRIGYTRIEAYILTGIGDLYTQLDAPAAAQMAYRLARDLARKINQRYLLLHLDLAEAAQARSRGDLVLAHNLLSSAHDYVREGNSGYELGMYCLESGQLALLEGKVDDAVRQLTEAVRLFGQAKRRIAENQAYIHLAHACYLAANTDMANQYFGIALREVLIIEELNDLMPAARQIKSFLEMVKVDQLIEPHVSRLLFHIDQFETRIPAMRRTLRSKALEVPFEPPKIVIQAFGDVKVIVNGKILTNADWQVLGARDLFLYLIANPDGATKGSIGAMFWPEKPPEQLKTQFKSTIYRLRNALKQDVVLYQDDRYFFNRSIDYAYDVEIFQEKISQARLMQDPAQRADLYREATALYKGHYLMDVDGSWVMPERERLRQAYENAILSLAEYHLGIGEYPICLDYSWRALQKDSCLEEAHRFVMRAYAAMGNRAGIVKQYEVCQAALKDTYRANPAPQTEKLYRDLTR